MSGNHIKVIIIAFFTMTIAVLAVIFFFSNKNNSLSNSNTINNNNLSTIAERQLKYTISGGNAVLTFPVINASVTVPLDYFTFSRQELDEYNSDSSVMLNCGLIYKKISSGAIFGVSYPMSGVCGTERLFSMISDEVFQGTSQTLCERIDNIKEYSGCEQAQNPPNGFVGVNFYEYVPRYGVDNSGYIAKSYYFFSADLKTKHRILFTYVPPIVARDYIGPEKFSSKAKDIINGQDNRFAINYQDMQIFSGIIDSLTLK